MYHRYDSYALNETGWKPGPQGTAKSKHRLRQIREEKKTTSRNSSFLLSPNTPYPLPYKKRLSPGMRSSLKDDGGWGPSPSKRGENDQEGNTPSGRPKPLHPILLYQGVWALGPTGVEDNWRFGIGDSQD